MAIATIWLLMLAVAAPAAAQHSVPEASDAGSAGLPHSVPVVLPSGTSAGPDMAMWGGAGTTFYNRSRAGGGWTGNGLGAEFHVFGGELIASQWGTTRTNAVETYSVSTRTWRIHPAAMPIPVSNISGACEVQNGVIYVFGGFDDSHSAVDNIQAFDGTSFFDTGARLSEAAWGVGAMNDRNGRIVAFGGFGTSSGSSKVSCDLFTAPSTVQAGVPMPGNLYLTTGAYNPKSRTSHALGGFGKERTHYVWNGSAWSIRQPPFSLRAGCGMAAGKDLVAAIAGGWNTYRKDQEVYDTRTNQWRSYTGVGTLAQGRRSFAHGITFSNQFPNRYCFMAVGGWSGGPFPLPGAEKIE